MGFDFAGEYPGRRMRRMRSDDFSRRLVREHRLYQASFLLRDYGFDLEDLPFTSAGRLPLEHDPKLGWAKENLRDQPVELNKADRRSLLAAITPLGRERQAAGARKVQDVRRRLGKALGEIDAAALKRALAQLR